MNKRIKSTFSWILVISILLSVMPGRVWATGTESSEVVADVTVQTPSEDLQASEVTESEPTILEEDVSLRGEYEKHFLMSDGSYQAALYHEPVHQMQDGQWVEIDNTLSLQTSADGTARYATANGHADVSFSESFDDRLVTMQQGEYSLAWGVEAVSNSISMSASVQPIQAELVAEGASVLSAEEQKTLIAKASSAIQYRNALRQNVDLEYIVLPSRVKENIILQSPQDISGYMVTVYTENLSARLLENREIQFYNSSDEVIFTMTSPYMYDSAGELSENITVELVSKGTGCYYIAMTPDAQWLSDESRVYPVVIDPQVTTDTTRTNIIDNYVLKGAGNQNRNLDRLYIGNRSEGLTRAYIKFDTMPTIPTGSTINAATMTVWITSGTSTGYTANAYKVISGDWSSDTITWANQPTGNSLMASNISHNNLTKYSFSCLPAVQTWYDGSNTGQNANYGVMMCYSDSNVDDYNAFYSADHTEESKRPSITIKYEPPSTAATVEEGKTYTLSSAGISGAITWASNNTGVATVNSSGKVTGIKAGQATITASVGGVVQKNFVVYVRIANGVYYLKNNGVNFYLGTNGGIADNTRACMFSKSTSGISQVRQLWRITYLDNGYYSIRPLHKLDMAVGLSSSNVVIRKTSSIDSISNVPSGFWWSISYDSGGYNIKYWGSNGTVMRTADGAASPGLGVVISSYVSTDTRYRWTLEKLSNPPMGVFIYDTVTGAVKNNTTIRFDIKDGSLTLKDLNLITSVYHPTQQGQDVSWTSLSPSVASVVADTGKLTIKAPGKTQIKASFYSANGLYNARVTSNLSLLALSEGDVDRNSYMTEVVDCYSSVSNSIYSETFSTMTTQKGIGIFQNSKNLIIHTHGKQNGVYLGNSYIEMDSLDGVDLSYLEFALLLTCNTGKEGYDQSRVDNGTPINIIEQMVICGAETVVGFSAITYTDECNILAGELTRMMIQEGKTIDAALWELECEGGACRDIAHKAVVAGNGYKCMS